jgi:hypothetical protein
MSNQAKVLHFNQLAQLIWMRDSEPHLESQHLARTLGYVQPGSIRKQVMSDWEEEFLHDEDFVIIKDEEGEEELRAYEAFEVLHFGSCKPAKLARGRMFLTPSGIRKVLKKSTKSTKEFEMFLEGHVFCEGLVELTPDPGLFSLEDMRKTMPVFQQFEEASSTSEVSSPSSQQGDSKTKYEVIQKLLHNLKEHEEPSLRELAIEGAELMLERRLDDIRKKFLGQVKPSPPPKKTEGPLFEEEGWYGCKQIGEMAGGYSSTTAGKAATAVGERWGYSSTKIRKTQLPFNKLVEAPDTNGRLRPQFRFNRAFSNEVILELRSNTHLTPVPTVPADIQLGASRSFPNLAKGPFDEEEEETSEHVENFLEVLSQNKH